MAAQAATQQTLNTGTVNITANSTTTVGEKKPNDDKFNFIIANPNTTEPKKFIFELKPGQKSEDYVFVKNASDVPLKFTLYGADETRSNQGSFALKTKNQPAEYVGKWIKFDDKELILQPGEIKKERFTVEIPQDAQEGAYSGGVSAEKSKADAMNPNVTIAVRIGIRVDVKVTAEPHPAAKKYADTMTNPWMQAYFWGSLALFIGSTGSLAYAYIKGRNPKKHSGIALRKKKR